MAVEASGGLDYLIFGTIFPTTSKPEGHPVAGPEALRAAVAACRLPVLGIGGITLENVDRVAAAGAAGVAAIGLFLGSRSGSGIAGSRYREHSARLRRRTDPLNSTVFGSEPP